MLFGGITHSDEVGSAATHLDAHREKLLVLQKVAPNFAMPSAPPPVAPPINGQASQNGPIPNALMTAPPAAARAPWEPPDVVARPNSEPRHQVLTAELAQKHYNIQWFMLPTGMGGTWLKDGDLTTAVVDLRTGVSSRTGTWTPNHLEAKWGHQVDGKGNIWHVNLLPSERDGDSSGKQVHFLTVQQQCEKSTPKELITRTHYVVSESSGWSGQPIDTFQQESLNHYAVLASGLTVTSSNRVFSYQGQPIRDGQLLSKYRKTANFVPIETLGGIDLKDSLDDYLQSIAD